MRKGEGGEQGGGEGGGESLSTYAHGLVGAGGDEYNAAVISGHSLCGVLKGRRWWNV